MEYLAGLDLGTTEVKGGFFSLSGDLLACSMASYGLSTEECPGAATSDPGEWWRAFCRVLTVCTSKAPPGILKGIAVGSHGPSLVALDRRGRPVRSSLIWMDRRAVEEALYIQGKTGRRTDAAWYIPKALWLKNKEPDTFREIRWLMQPLDYLTYRLTGTIKASLCSEHLRPWDEITIEAAGLDRSLFPPYALMSELLGHVSASASRATGLPEGTPVFSGTGGADFVEVLLGASTLEEGAICDKGGTTQGVNLCWRAPIRGHGFFTIPHPLLPSSFHIGAMLSTTGKALQWYKDLFYHRRTPYEKVLLEAEKSPPGAKGLFFLPYLAGARAPWWDPHARGVFFGLSLAHRREDLARAIIEGVAYEIASITKLFKGEGASLGAVTTSGGQARSSFWSQIKADVTGLPVKVPRIVNGETLGMALIAGKGAGLYQSLIEASRRLVRIAEVFEPREGLHQFYHEKVALFEKLYPSLRESFLELPATEKGDCGDRKDTEA
ncbi:MAG: FGGY-family carbohydrate kinase [Candidatus Eremiobacteraeota bacterium]|nr:FGGY-family carbohydrate kinase [Candidatus Eremiobacteraeota bacterium]